MNKTHLFDQTLLIVDDDAIFTRAAARALSKRGFDVREKRSFAEAAAELRDNPPAYALIDLRLGDGSGLDLLEILQQSRPDARAVILTAYGDLSTAVSATKLGAVDYMAKPADADAISAALRGETRKFIRNAALTRPEEQELRYLLSIFEEQDRNMSRTARLISKHRRSLQRILRRHGVEDEGRDGEESLTTRQRIRRLLKFWQSMLEGELRYDDRKISMQHKRVLESSRQRRPAISAPGTKPRRRTPDTASQIEEARAD